MTSAKPFEAAASGKTTIALMLNSLEWDAALAAILPEGAVILPLPEATGCMQRDFGYRAVEMVAGDVNAFLGRVAETGVARDTHRMEPRALVPVTYQVPSAP